MRHSCLAPMLTFIAGVLPELTCMMSAMSYLQSGAIVLRSGEGHVLAGPEGLTVKVGRDETTSGSVAMLESTADPGFGPPLHVHHDSEELFYVIDGEFECQVGDDVVTVSAGSFILVPRGTVHAPRVVGTGPATVLIVFAPAGPDKVFDELAQLASEIGGPPQPDDDRVTAILARYDSEFVEPAGPRTSRSTDVVDY